MNRHVKPLHKDPVCGMQLSIDSAAEVAIYRGKRYYFCSALCREAFEAEPQQYINGRRNHPSADVRSEGRSG